MYEGQVILVTGTSRGIGVGLVEHFLKSGALVEGCSRTSSKITHDNYHHTIADVSSEVDMASMMRGIQERRNRLDAIINNAAITHQGFVMTSGMSALQPLFETNVFGAYFVSREGARLMQRRKYGRIVNMGSIALKMKMEGSAIYTASKGAVLELTKVLAKELGPFNITCNMVAPGLFDTEMFQNLSGKIQEKCMDQLAIKRMSSIYDLTNVLDFLLRKESNLITGQEICIGTTS